MIGPRLEILDTSTPPEIDQPGTPIEYMIALAAVYRMYRLPTIDPTWEGPVGIQIPSKTRDRLDFFALEVFIGNLVECWTLIAGIEENVSLFSVVIM